VSRFLSAHLEYPVELPRFDEERSNVRLVGARLASIANRDAAYVMYDQRGARISLFAYPKPRRFAPPPGFGEREAHGRTLQVGTHRGYNVVTWLSGNTVYALVSEVDHDRLVELAASQDR
jgi:anti-sigma factor RsiW